jgi:hypothetical protein
MLTVASSSKFVPAVFHGIKFNFYLGAGLTGNQPPGLRFSMASAAIGSQALFASPSIAAPCQANARPPLWIIGL